MLLTDTHCHLDRLGEPHEIRAVVERALQAGVRRILVPGTNLASSRQAVELAGQYEEVYAAVGNHPNDGDAWDDQTLSSLAELINYPKVVAVGEIGLDFYRPYTPHEQQRNILQLQLQLAKKYSRPVIIHSRQSLVELIPLLLAWKQELEQEQNPLSSHPGVLHSYDGDQQNAAAALRNGFLLGISGPVTYRNAQERQELVRNLTLENILIETDSPYLTPHPHRGQPNEPAFVRYIAEKIAELHQVPLEVVVQQTWKNAERQFSWGATG